MGEPTPEQVERGARALWDHGGGSEWKKWNPWGKMRKADKDRYRDSARVVLCAALDGLEQARRDAAKEIAEALRERGGRINKPGLDRHGKPTTNAAEFIFTEFGGSDA